MEWRAFWQLSVAQFLPEPPPGLGKCVTCLVAAAFTLASLCSAAGQDESWAVVPSPGCVAPPGWQALLAQRAPPRCLSVRQQRSPIRLAAVARVRCSCDPPGVLRPAGFDCVALCSSWGDDLSPPPSPRITSFERISFLPRCDTLEFTQAAALQGLTRRLRDSAFAEALNIYVRDLEDAAERLNNLSGEFQEFNTSCRAFNDEARGFDEGARDWNQSECILGVFASGEAGCAHRRGELLNQKSALQDRYRELSARSNSLSNSFQQISAKAEPAVRNANIILNPGNIERVFRLYISHTLRNAGLNACQAFARIATTLGRAVTEKEEFITYLTRNVIDPEDNQVALLNALGIVAHWDVAPPVAGQMRGFNSSGFKSKFKNEARQTKNLVRHAASHLLTGYTLPYGITSTQLISYYRDTLGQQYLRGNVAEYGDYYLAIAAGQLGVQLRHGRVRPSDFGASMIPQLCD